MKRIKRIASLCAILAGSAGGSGCTSQPAAAEIHVKAPEGEAWLTPQQLKESHIKTITAAEQNVRGMVSVGGKVAFDDQRTTHVFSPVTGRVTKVLAELGQRVTKGTPLLAITSPDVGNAFSDLAKAKADFEAAEHEYNRQKDLYAAHAGAQREMETAEDNFRKTQAELERAKQKARLFKSGGSDAVTQEYVLRAPIDGQVIARNANPGVEVSGLYTGGNAIELFTIGELDKVWIVAEVSEIDIEKLKVGADVSVKVIAFPNRTFTGKVDWVSAVLDPTMHTAKIRCSVANPDLLLKPEMYGTVTISGSGEPALAIPRKALLRLGEQMVVFVMRGKTNDGKLRFERQPVSIDEDESGDLVPVRNGIKAGDDVVTDGAILLSEMT